MAHILLTTTFQTLPCRCNFNLSPVNGSILDVTFGTRDINPMLPLLSQTKSTHTEAGISNRPAWVPTLTRSVRFLGKPGIAMLPCMTPGARGEDSVLLRSFFTTNDVRPIRNLTFLEVGAYDGYTESVTYAMEKCLGWSGVLIEPHPHTYKKLIRSGRTASVFENAAICKEPTLVSMTRMSGTPARIVSTKHTKPGKKMVHCFPLRRFLNQYARIDLLSIDVEGHEPDAAESIKGSRASVGVVMAEVTVGHRRTATMQSLLAQGFTYVGLIDARPSPANYVMSDVFVNLTHFQRFLPESRIVQPHVKARNHHRVLKHRIQ